MSASKFKKFFILEDIKSISYFDNGKKLNLTRGNPKIKTSHNKYFISLTNKFYILPKESNLLFRDNDIQNTISLDFNASYKKKNRTNNLIFNYQTKNKKNSKHISYILYSNIYKSEESDGIYFSIIEKKTILLYTQNKKLIFYNQFDFNKNNYIKYLVLLFDEFNLDQERDSLTYISSEIDENKIIDELKYYFKKIIKYKKSIFNIIIEENA